MVGFIKGKSATTSRVCTEKGSEISSAKAFGLADIFVSTVGRDEAVIRQYIKNQEAEDHRLEQLSLWG